VAKIRVYELAKELGVDSKTLMRTLNEYGEFVRSASSTIEPPTVRRVRAAYAERPPEPAHPAAGTRRHNPYAPSLSARRLYAQPVSSRRTTPGRPDRLEAVEQVFGREAVRRVSGSDADGPFGRDGYDLSWKKHFIEREVYEEFVAAGLGYERADLAADCLAAGLHPADLVVGLGSHTVLGWLCQGQSAAKVATTLRECREDPRSAHLVDERPRMAFLERGPRSGRDRDLEPPTPAV